MTFDFDTSKDVNDFLRSDFLFATPSTVVPAVFLLQKEQTFCCTGSLITLNAACLDEEDFSIFSCILDEVVALAASLFKPEIPFDFEVL